MGSIELQGLWQSRGFRVYKDFLTGGLGSPGFKKSSFVISFHCRLQ